MALVVSMTIGDGLCISMTWTPKRPLPVITSGSFGDSSKASLFRLCFHDHIRLESVSRGCLHFISRRCHIVKKLFRMKTVIENVLSHKNEQSYWYTFSLLQYRASLG